MLPILSRKHWFVIQLSISVTHVTQQTLLDQFMCPSLGEQYCVLIKTMVSEVPRFKSQLICLIVSYLREFCLTSVSLSIFIYKCSGGDLVMWCVARIQHCTCICCPLTKQQLLVSLLFSWIVLFSMEGSLMSYIPSE